jgi:hypothetical protein
MDRGRVGEDRGSKETDGCPLTSSLPRVVFLLVTIVLLVSRFTSINSIPDVVDRASRYPSYTLSYLP